MVASWYRGNQMNSKKEHPTDNKMRAWEFNAASGIAFIFSEGKINWKGYFDIL